MKDIESLKSAYVPWMQSFGLEKTLDRIMLKQHEVIERLNKVSFDYNDLLETQALALEGMKKEDLHWHTFSGDDQSRHEGEGFNAALQQAADHLRAQKITE